MKADIFIPTSNRINALAQCMKSLDRQTFKNFKIYLVGIEKSVSVEELLRDYIDLEVEYFIQKKPGIIGAANEALEKARNEIFIRIDDDVVLDDAWFENLIKTFEADVKIGGVTGPTIMSEEGIKSRDLTAFLDKFSKSKNFALRWLSYFYSSYIYENKIYDVSKFLRSGAFTLGSNFENCLKIKSQLEVDNLEACNWSCRMEILKKNGGFDEVYLKGLGDYHESDAAFMIKESGYKLIFNPLVKLKHNVEIGKVKKARPMPYYRIQNFFIFYGRHIKIKSLDHLMRFMANVFLQNGYYIFRFLTTGSFDQFGAIPGTFVGIVRGFMNNKKLSK